MKLFMRNRKYRVIGGVLALSTIGALFYKRKDINEYIQCKKIEKNPSLYGKFCDDYNEKYILSYYSGLYKRGECAYLNYGFSNQLIKKIIEVNPLTMNDMSTWGIKNETINKACVNAIMRDPSVWHTLSDNMKHTLMNNMTDCIVADGCAYRYKGILIDIVKSDCYDGHNIIEILSNFREIHGYIPPNCAYHNCVVAGMLSYDGHHLHEIDPSYKNDYIVMSRAITLDPFAILYSDKYDHEFLKRCLNRNRFIYNELPKGPRKDMAMAILLNTYTSNEELERMEFDYYSWCHKHKY